MEYYLESQIKQYFKEVIEAKIGKTINFLTQDEVVVAFNKISEE